MLHHENSIYDILSLIDWALYSVADSFVISERAVGSYVMDVIQHGQAAQVRGTATQPRTISFLNPNKF